MNVIISGSPLNTDMMDLNETNTPITEAPAEITAESLVSLDEQAKELSFKPKQTKEEVIERLKEINEDARNANKQEIDFLKQNFYKLLKSQQEALRKAHIENGGNAEDFVMPADTSETQFKEVMKSIKEQRSALIAEQEQLKEENFLKKQAILERLKVLAESSEDANKAYPEFKQLQQEWNEIKLVPASKVNELWSQYQLYAEKFYDIIKLNNEFRDYDFKKNLAIKQHLCEAAEKLADEEDVISAFHQLQKLHQEFRDTGPINKELRNEIWARFKAASTIINKRHQQHFEEQKEKEQHNLDEKIVICEIVEGLEYDTFTSFQDWDNKTEEILALQAKWKTIGYAPQKMNVKIFERFRKACDDFFKRKAAFFKNYKEEMSKNLEKKRALCEKAEALKDSTDWKKTAEMLSQIQKDWRKIGPVPKKHSDSIWKRFIGACDYFFEQKAQANNSQLSTEMENMAKKKAILEQLEAINNANTPDEHAGNTVRTLMKEWNNIGHIPYKEKDRFYKLYHDLIDEIFKKLNISISQKKLNNFKSNFNKENNVHKERERLMRQYEKLKLDIKTYENNLGFLSSSSKKGNSLVTEISRKVNKLKDDMALIQQKLEVIEQSQNKE